MITTEYSELLPGDTIVVSGEPVAWESASNPGQFDAQSYYFSQNTVCMLSHASILERKAGRESLKRMLFRLRRALGGSYERILDGEEAGIMRAVSLGERARLPAEWKDLFQEGGISHILAVSGLHVSLIGMCLYRLLRRLGAPFGASCAVSGTAVVLYALMSGSGVSAVRAVIMFLFWLGAQFWGRKYDMITAAASAALLLLMRDARSLGQASFLLSFSAVLSIAVLLPCLRKIFLEGSGRGSVRPVLGEGLAGTLLSCAGVWLGTLPVTLYFFYQTVPWSTLINLAVLPLMSALMACGLLSAAAGLFSVKLGIFFAAPVHYILGGFEFLCRLKEHLPGPLWVAGRPALWRIALYYGILALALAASYRMLGQRRGRAGVRARADARIQTDARAQADVKKRARRLCRASVCLLWPATAVCCVSLMAARAPARLEVFCLDAGQGDAALLRLPGGVSCLIDGGSSSETDVWRYRIGQTVKYCGISALDYIFLSHADRDHISGIEEYLREYEPGFRGENVHGVTLGCLVLPPTADADDFLELRELAREKGIEVVRIEAGACLGGEGRESAWSLACLAPDSRALSGDRNGDSMVLKLQYGAFRMLFTGDLEGEAERRLADSGTDLSADVLKVGHHGSRNASSEGFLKQVSPAAAVISCGENNLYGHPARETVERLQAAGSRIFETPECGAVMIASDGEMYSVETYLSEN